MVLLEWLRAQCSHPAQNGDGARDRPTVGQPEELGHVGGLLLDHELERHALAAGAVAHLINGELNRSPR